MPFWLVSHVTSLTSSNNYFFPTHASLPNISHPSRFGVIREKEAHNSSSISVIGDIRSFLLAVLRIVPCQSSLLSMRLVTHRCSKGEDQFEELESKGTHQKKLGTHITVLLTDTSTSPRGLRKERNKTRWPGRETRAHQVLQAVITTLVAPGKMTSDGIAIAIGPAMIGGGHARAARM